jgi:hypothetical protein
MKAAWNVRRANGVRSGARRVNDFLAAMAGDGDAGTSRLPPEAR